MAITRPSIGVKPIVVSTQRPSRTAASEAPAPRWHDTTREAAARREAWAWERPWKPKRRRPKRSRHARGSAYVVAAAGSVAWNAVSKQATAGTGPQRAPDGVHRVERRGLVQRGELDELAQPGDDGGVDAARG